jgi:hypothetical protein
MKCSTFTFTGGPKSGIAVEVSVSVTGSWDSQPITSNGGAYVGIGPSVVALEPSGPSAATSTAWPSSSSARLSNTAIRISSSTTSTRMPAGYETPDVKTMRAAGPGTQM